MKTHSPKKLTFSYAIKSFLGFLEGTEKSAHTISSYHTDLKSFHHFLNHELSNQPVPLNALSLKDVEAYSEFLKNQGFKTNTRRRKILTVRRFLRYLNIRKKFGIDISQKIPAPYKVERVPYVVPISQLIQGILTLPSEHPFEARNRLLLWSLAETGAQVSEVTHSKFSHWSRQSAFGQPALEIHGKSPRLIPVSLELYESVMRLKKKVSETQSHLFLGFNKFGPLKSPISARGIELLVKIYSKKLGFPRLVPRTFRHSAVVHWYQNGIQREEIQRRLGLKTEYAFRTYEPLFKSTIETTSTSQNPQ